MNLHKRLEIQTNLADTCRAPANPCAASPISQGRSSKICAILGNCRTTSNSNYEGGKKQVITNQSTFWPIWTSKTYMYSTLRSLPRKILSLSLRGCYTLRLYNKYHSLYYHQYKDRWGILRPIQGEKLKVFFGCSKKISKCLQILDLFENSEVFFS